MSLTHKIYCHDTEKGKSEGFKDNTSEEAMSESDRKG